MQELDRLRELAHRWNELAKAGEGWRLLTVRTMEDVRLVASHLPLLLDVADAAAEYIAEISGPEGMADSDALEAALQKLTSLGETNSTKSTSGERP